MHKWRNHYWPLIVSQWMGHSDIYLVFCLQWASLHLKRVDSFILLSVTVQFIRHLLRTHREKERRRERECQFVCLARDTVKVSLTESACATGSTSFFFSSFSFCLSLRHLHRESNLLPPHSYTKKEEQIDRQSENKWQLSTFLLALLPLLVFTFLYSTLLHSIAYQYTMAWCKALYILFACKRLLLRKWKSERGRGRGRGIKVNWLPESTLHCCCWEEYSCLFAKYLT